MQNDLPEEEKKPTKKEKQFSTREQQLVALTFIGHSHKMMADALGISINTVSAEKRLMHLKFDVHNVAMLLAYASSHGFKFLPLNKKVYYWGKLIKW